MARLYVFIQRGEIDKSVKYHKICFKLFFCMHIFEFIWKINSKYGSNLNFTSDFKKNKKN